MEPYRIIDADAHMSEPFDLWTTRIDSKFRDRAPRLVNDYKGTKGSFFVFEDFVTRFSSQKEGASRSGGGEARIRNGMILATQQQGEAAMLSSVQMAPVIAAAPWPPSP